MTYEEAWREFKRDMAERFDKADKRARLKGSAYYRGLAMAYHEVVFRLIQLDPEDPPPNKDPNP